ncbi:hypothetical protein SAMN05444156_1406 [Verrucomicrobium sp. GAS474]|uniref:hypothetical protein n=1 Tax=Verrucomicrobium sp. GAS474 TaxID=1882831 RepID=UPI00087BB19B|nr:hypothetical protein [Verrucomicrobium sp. GAS474]SDU00754.1 hypothetical protein SAMN05444156_1406 [Verrucomicrobium sp. GAS474]
MRIGTAKATRHAGAALLLLFTSARALTPGTEEISPQPQTADAVIPGLSRTRAVPPEPEIDFAAPEVVQQGLFTDRPLYNPGVLRPERHINLEGLPLAYDPGYYPYLYRDVISSVPAFGLQPTPAKQGLFTITPYAGVTHTYESNINLSPDNHIGDYFTTLSAGADFQVGTPDSVYTERYDTILGLHGHYLFTADVFDTQDRFNALNNQLNLDGRIGRGSAIWRPYLTMEDFTSTGFEDRDNERIGRVKRQILAPGIHGDYQVTSQSFVSQDFSWTHMKHPQNGVLNELTGDFTPYIDADTWNYMTQAGTRVLPNVDVFVWNNLRQTEVSRGSAYNELINGFGWRGKPDPRLFTEVLFGWDAMSFTASDGNPNRHALSGWRMSGHTSFDWSPRLRLTLKYDRLFQANELDKDNNYTSSAVQFIPEVFLGGNWYLIPQVALTDYTFERTLFETIELRPEVELAYRLPDKIGSDSRIYVKGTYLRTETVVGDGHQTEDFRLSTGIAMKF